MGADPEHHESITTANRGQFVIICGIDGSGKTTQERLLAKNLQGDGRRVLCTRSPTDWYRTHPDVRKFLDSGQSRLRPETLASLSAADRMIQNDIEIQPALEAGIDVVCNRYIFSTFAYFKQRGADMSFVENVNSKVLAPDKAILIMVDPELAITRIIERDGGRLKFEERDSVYLGRVQAEMTARWPSHSLKVDGMASVDIIERTIYEYVRAR